MRFEAQTSESQDTQELRARLHGTLGADVTSELRYEPSPMERFAALAQTTGNPMDVALKNVLPAMRGLGALPDDAAGRKGEVLGTMPSHSTLQEFYAVVVDESGGVSADDRLVRGALLPPNGGMQMELIVALASPLTLAPSVELLTLLRKVGLDCVGSTACRTYNNAIFRLFRGQGAALTLPQVVANIRQFLVLAGVSAKAREVQEDYGLVTPSQRNRLWRLLVLALNTPGDWIRHADAGTLPVMFRYAAPFLAGEGPLKGTRRDGRPPEFHEGLYARSMPTPPQLDTFAKLSGAGLANASSRKKLGRTYINPSGIVCPPDNDSMSMLLSMTLRADETTMDPHLDLATAAGVAPQKTLAGTQHAIIVGLFEGTQSIREFAVHIVNFLVRGVGLNPEFPVFDALEATSYQPGVHLDTLWRLLHIVLEVPRRFQVNVRRTSRVMDRLVEANRQSQRQWRAEEQQRGARRARPAPAPAAAPGVLAILAAPRAREEHPRSEQTLRVRQENARKKKQTNRQRQKSYRKAIMLDAKQRGVVLEPEQVDQAVVDFIVQHGKPPVLERRRPTGD